jgi:predicted enzyme related to lactoylglutathione lyase
MNRPVHFEIHAQEPERAMAFYRTLLGWRFERWGEIPYWVVLTGDSAPGIDGGLLPRRGPPPVDGAAVNAWVCTVEVEDLDRTVAAAERAGGRLALPKMAIGEMGWVAYVKDTEGNLLGLMQNAPKK